MSSNYGRFICLVQRRPSSRRREKRGGMVSITSSLKSSNQRSALKFVRRNRSPVKFMSRCRVEGWPHGQAYRLQEMLVRQCANTGVYLQLESPSDYTKSSAFFRRRRLRVIADRNAAVILTSQTGCAIKRLDHLRSGEAAMTPSPPHEHARKSRMAAKSPCLPRRHAACRGDGKSRTHQPAGWGSAGKSSCRREPTSLQPSAGSANSSTSAPARRVYLQRRARGRDQAYG